MRKVNWLLLALCASCVGAACSAAGTPGSEEEVSGSLDVALKNVPSDVSCVKVSVTGSRPVVQLIDVVSGAASNYTISRLPIGIVTVSGEAYPLACNAVAANSVPSHVSEAPVSVRVDAVDVNAVTLNLIRNGRLAVGVDFEVGPQPFLVPTAAGVNIKALFNVGDSVNTKPNGTPYRLVGLIDGLGAFDNTDGTFTLLANHEISSGGAVRAHGAAGAFVSKWKIRKSDLTVLRGDDLIQTVSKFDPATATYLPPATGVAFSRFCAADLPALSAFYDAASGAGFNGRLFMNGEEIGAEGKAWAHGLDGTSWEFPRMGKASWENLIAHPATGMKTVVVGMDDTTPGQVYVYIGTKTTTGSPVQQAGLTNGALYGVAVTGGATEPAAGFPSGTAFTLASLGNVETSTGAALDTNSTAAGVTRFNRPEDGAWDPNNPTDFYFVTTASFTTPTRLWRLRFSDLNNLAAGGTIEMLLDGTEGGKMYDNMTVTKKGQIYLQEDTGNNAHTSKIWRYTIATDTLTLIAQHNPALFTTGAAQFLTQDEESSGIIDATDLIGPGWFLLDSQAHYANTDSELIEGGQLLALYDPANL